MKFLKKTIVALILALFLCLSLKQPIKPNATTNKKYIYGTITLKNIISFDDIFESYFEENSITFKYNNRSINVNGIRVRTATIGNDLLLDYYCNLNNSFEWITFYSETVGDWNNNNAKTLYVNNFVETDNALVSFLNQNLSSFIGFPIKQGTYYLSNSYNSIDNNISNECNLALYNSSGKQVSWNRCYYENNGVSSCSVNNSFIFESNGDFRFGTSGAVIKYFANTKNWAYVNGSTRINFLIPNISVIINNDSFIRPNVLTNVFINDPTYWLVNYGFVKSYKLNISLPQNFSVLPYNPTFICGSNLTLQINGNAQFRVARIEGTAQYNVIGNTLNINNIKSDLNIYIVVEYIATQINISTNQILGQVGNITCINNTINFVLDYTNRNNLTLNIQNKDTGSISNIDDPPNVLQIINGNGVCGVVYKYYGYHFRQIQIMKYINNELISTKIYNSSDAQLFNALNEFTNDDGFFTITAGTRYEINIDTADVSPPSENENVENAVKNIFDAFVDLINIKIGWWSIGSILSIIITLSILVFIVKLWKGGS